MGILLYVLIGGIVLFLVLAIGPAFYGVSHLGE